MLGYRRRDDGMVFADGGAGRRVIHTIARIIDFAFTFIYTVLAVLFFLELFQARRGTGFYELIRKLSAPFYGPFREIVSSTRIDAGHVVVWSILVAMLAYAVLHGVIRALMRVGSRRF